MRKTALLFGFLSACSPPGPNDRLVAADPPSGWRDVAQVAWSDYGAAWDRPRVTFNGGSVSPCDGAGSFRSISGTCVKGETVVDEGLIGTEELRISVVAGDWRWTLRHELLHACFYGSDAWGDPDPGHTRPEWPALGLLP